MSAKTKINTDWNIPAIASAAGSVEFMVIEGDQLYCDDIEQGALDAAIDTYAHIPSTMPAVTARDQALAALTHDFGDGRVIQCRPHPFPDESNMRNAIEQMVRLGQVDRPWYMANNTKAQVTPADLQTAIEAGQDGSAVIWAQFFTAIDG